ncbi:hypothetical protein K1719_026518 [Acacia pycnantha]|nr:hypothetical protein K1719_026518 [Acacia pycnantha]
MGEMEGRDGRGNQRRRVGVGEDDGVREVRKESRGRFGTSCRSVICRSGSVKYCFLPIMFCYAEGEDGRPHAQPLLKFDELAQAAKDM